MTPAAALDAVRGNAVATAQEAAAILGVDERTVRRSIERGELPGLRLGTRVVIPVPRLLALIEPDAPVLLAEPRDAEGLAVAIEILRGALAALERLAATPPRVDRPGVA